MRHGFARRFDHVALTRLVPRARDMRVHPARTEALLWPTLRGGRLGGCRVLRLGADLVERDLPAALAAVRAAVAAAR